MSATSFFLMSLIPYTRENALLTQKPHQFFAELEQQGSSRSAYTQARGRALKKGLVTPQGEELRLTEEGYRRLLKDVLANRATQPRPERNYLVCFDIPETRRKARLYLREALSTLGFQQIQRSVWIGSAAYAEDVSIAARLLRVPTDVQMFHVKQYQPRP